MTGALAVCPAYLVLKKGIFRNFKAMKMLSQDDKLRKSLPCLLRHQGPQLVKVDAGLVEVGVVGVDVEVPHSNLSEVSRMVLVKVDSVVMLATSVSATSGVLPVLSDPAMTVGHVSSQLPGLLLGCGHSYF